MQICRICGIKKSLSSFTYRKDSRKYRTECDECRSKVEVARRYNITVGDIDRMREEQGDCCAICGVHSSQVPHKSFTYNPLVVDHCHATGAVRGLLCPSCNTGIGMFMDNVSLLASAIQYLSK